MNQAGAAGEPERREEMLAALDELPPMGPVAMRVLELMNDPHASAADFARVISRDQGLAAKVLRTCNSPFYGLASEVQSLSQAVVILGQRAVRNLVYFHSLPVGRATGGRITDVEQGLWSHSVAGALACRLVAQRAGGFDPELAFLAGLFHDLGRLLLMQVRPLTYDQLCRQSPDGKPDLELEQTHLGIVHTEVGAEALRRWRLGEELAEVALHHHQPPAEVQPLVRVVIAAEWLDLGQEDTVPPAAALEAMRLLGLHEDQIGELRERVRASVQQEQQFFRLAA